MGWTFTWASSYGSDFTYDSGVSFAEEDCDRPVFNFGTLTPGLLDRAGDSVFFKDEDGAMIAPTRRTGVGSTC